MNPNCVLLYGNDAYGIKKHIDQILAEAEIKEEDTEIYDYEEDGLEGALQSAMTLPFLAEKKAVVLKNCSFLSDKNALSAEAAESLKRYCGYLNPTTLWIMTVAGEKLDYRKNLVKYLTKNIEAKAFNQSNDTKSIYKAIQEAVEKNGLVIDSLALTQFVNRIGNDSEMLENELEKLITYALDKKRITSDMVYDVVSRDIESNIFELVNAYLAKDVNKTLGIYRDLQSIKIDPIWMLGTITSKFQEILYTKELLRLRYKNEDIMKYFNASKGRVYYMVQNARNIEDDRLVQLLTKAEDLDFRIKSGQIDKDLGIELFLLDME